MTVFLKKYIYKNCNVLSLKYITGKHNILSIKITKYKTSLEENIKSKPTILHVYVIIFFILDISLVYSIGDPLARIVN